MVAKELITLRDVVEKINLEQQDVVAFESLVQDETSLHQGKSLTYGALQAEVRHVGTALLDLAGAPGEKIGILSENRLEWVNAFLAIPSCGCQAVTFDMFLEQEDLLAQLEHSGVTILFTSARYLEKIARIQSRLSALTHIICFDESETKSSRKKNSTSPRYLTYAALVEQGRELYTSQKSLYATLNVSATDTAVIVYLSNSIGVKLSHKAILSNAVDSLEALGFDYCPGERWLAAVSYSHTYPYMFGIIMPLLVGTTVTILATSRAKLISQAIISCKPSYIILVPVLLDRICNYYSSKKTEFSIADFGLDALKSFFVVGVKCPVSIIEKMRALLLPVLEGYGLSETAPFLTFNSNKNHLDGSAGQPLQNVQIAIDKPDNNGVGEIIAKTPGLFSGYNNRKSKTSHLPNDGTVYVDNKGWLHTGDLGYLDTDNFLHITGRSRNIVVNIGGSNIYPEDITSVLNRSRYIKNTKIVPKFNSDHGEYPHAIVQIDRTYLKKQEEKKGSVFSDEELTALVSREVQGLSGNIAAYKLPVSFEITDDELDSSYAPFIFQEQMFSHAPHESERLLQGGEEKELMLERVSSDILVRLAAVLHVSTEEISEHDNFLDLVTSSELIDITHDLEQTYGVQIFPPVLFEHSTTASLTGFLTETYYNELKQYYKLEKSSASVDAPQDKKISVAGTKNASPSSRFEHEDIAIIGIAGRFPGSDNLEEFWNNLEAQKDLISEIPRERFDWREYSSDRKAANKCVTRRGGFINNIDAFDAPFFKISPKEAELMDPQQRIFLEVAWHAIEDAGYKPSSFSGSNTGMFVGVIANDYGELLLQQKIPTVAYTFTGTLHFLLPNRVSYLLNLNGPSEAIDAACASSLVAVHRAVQAIRNHECDTAIAGGVNALITPKLFISFSNAGMLSEDGKCKTFDKSANGYVRGEGMGAILLKPLRKAEADGDHIYAVIKGSAVNHGGRASSLTAPNPQAQAKLIVRAHEEARIDPETISYIEAHGTGTELGDPVEINGLKIAFKELYKKNRKSTTRKHYCGLSSIKTNIGHLEASAGIAGLLKIVLSMKHRKLPGTVHFTTLNPFIQLEDSPFYIIDKTRDWEALKESDGRDIPRRAGISSFGAGGSNAHIVIEEYIPTATTATAQTVTDQMPLVYVLSAKNEERLRAYAGDLIAFVEKVLEKECLEVGASEALFLRNLAYTLQNGREEMEARLAFVAAGSDEVLQYLKAYCQGADPLPGCYTGNSKKRRKQSKELQTEQDLVKATVKKKDLQGVARLWAKGATIDWLLLYPSNAPLLKRISLPGYPFEQHRFWIPEQDQEDHDNTYCDINVMTHPLLQHNISDFTTQRFSSVFSGNEFFLRDHHVAGNSVLPGVAYLEMARAAITSALGKTTEPYLLRLKNIVWSKPLVVDNAGKEVLIDLVPAENNSIAFTVYGRPGESSTEQELHSQGTAVVGPYEEAGTLAVDRLREECRLRTFTKHDCYDLFDAIGLVYGPAHQAIDTVYLGDNRVLARLVLPEHIDQTGDTYVLHPSLMDAALQASYFLTVDVSQPGSELSLSLPFALQELSIFRKCTAEMWAYVSYAEGSSKETRVRKVDIAITDRKGNLCVQLRGFSLQIVPSSGDQTALVPNNTFEFLMFHPVWKPGVVRPRRDVSAYQEHLVVFCGLDELYAKNSKASSPAVDFLHLFSEENNPALRYEAYATQLFEMIKRILERKPKGAIFLQLLIPRHNESPLYAGLTGLLQTARLEHPKFRWQVVELDETVHDLAAVITRGLDFPEQSRIQYAPDICSIMEWEAVPVQEESPSFSWRDEGIYLITGGKGGLGLIFAGEIARHSKKVTLILTGRSSLAPETEEKLREIERQGARIVYRQVDVTDAEAVAALFDEIRSEYGGLHGIIHSAGIIKDNYILKKDTEEFRQVLLPKVNGLLHIDEASREMRLDFFLCCSSIVGCLGNVGQADYAAANAFMDNYAHFRNGLVAEKKRYGKSISINWPLWKEGGMYVDEQTEAMLLQSMGMKAMSTTAGISGLYHALQYGKSQLLVVEGDASRISKKLGLPALAGNRKRDIGVAAAASAETISCSLHDAVSQLEASLQAAVASLLKIDIVNIDVDDELTDYGFDSIMFTEFSNNLNSEYDLELAPTIFFEYPTLHVFAVYLLETYPDCFPSCYVTTQDVEEAGRSDMASPGQAGNGHQVAGSDELEEHLKKAVASLLKIDIVNIDVDDELTDYGFDSIMFTEFSNNLNSEYDLELAPTIFFEYPTLHVFAVYLLETYPDCFPSCHVTTQDVEEAGQSDMASPGQAGNGHQVAGSDELEEHLKKAVASLLKIDIVNIDVDDELTDYGFDSIMFTEFSNNLNSEYDLDLAPTIFFEYPTLHVFAVYLLETYPEHFSCMHSSGRTLAETSTVTGASGLHIHTRFPSGTNETPFEQAAACEQGPESHTEREPIAVIGMSGRFPKADTLEEFWENLVAGRDCIEEVPSERWDWKDYYGDPATEENKTDVKWGGFINGADEFDPLFFGISPKEAESMDPQQRLLMTYVWKVIEDAGYSAKSLSGSKTGLIVGIANTGYNKLIYQAHMPLEGFTPMGYIPSVGPNRMSHFLNLRGPSEPVETACSSSLVALHRAILAIEQGSCDNAIVGGVSAIVHPELHISFSKAGMLSKDGRCKTFSENANGYVRGEGVGMLFLKKLRKAEEDGDRIYGIIRGSAVNHGGRVTTLTAPNPQAQADVIEEAVLRSGVTPETITYIEAHGTGTKLGDPIEINGLKQAFSRLYAHNNEEPATAYCGIGSVKSNIGHLEVAAGMASIIKVLLQMQHKRLVKSLHCETINPYIVVDKSPFYIVRQAQEWKALKADDASILPRRAGISSFGFGGVNAHVIVEEYLSRQKDAPQPEILEAGPVLITLSAKNRTQLAAQARALLDYIHEGKCTDKDLSNIAYTLQTARDAMNERLALLVKSSDELTEKLAGYETDNDALPGMFRGSLNAGSSQSRRLFQGKEGKEFIASSIRKRDYAKLAQLWVEGVDIDWKLLYPSQRPARITLPGYPFAREHYWIHVRERAAEQAGAMSLSSAREKAADRDPGIWDGLSYLACWEKEAVPFHAPNKEHRSVVIVSYDTAYRLDQAIAAYYARKTNARVTHIRLAETTAQCSATEWQCDIHDPEGFRNCLQHVDNIDALYFLAFREGEADVIESEAIDESLLRHELQLIRLVQGLEKLKSAGTIDTYILTLATSSMDGQPLRFEGAGVTGLAYALAQAAHQFRVRNIDLSLSDLAEKECREDLPGLVIDEPASDRGELIKIAAGTRYRQTFYRLHWDGVTNVSAIRPNGLYLIAGGSGTVGQIITRHLIEQYEARVVWLGRSAADAGHMKQKLESFAKYGNRLHYLEADLTDPDAVQNAVCQIKQEYGSIHGALFAGMVVDNENAIDRITEADFIAGTAVKRQGSWSFYQALAGEQLDFLCYFSSGQAYAFSGASHFAGYASGITFADALVHVIQKKALFPVGIINWGFWKKSLARIDSMSAEQIGALDDREGCACFERFLAALRHGGLPQAACMRLSSQVARLLNCSSQAFVSIEQAGDQVGTEADNAYAARQVAREDIFADTEQHVRAVLLDALSRALHIAPDNIDSGIAFSDYGINSIIGVAFIEEVNSRLGLALNTAIIFDYSSVDRLTEYLLKQYQTAIETTLTTAREKETVPAAQSHDAPGGVKEQCPISIKKMTLSAQPQKSDLPDRSEIAVVGISGMFPKAADPNQFWHNLVEGIDGVEELPASYLDQQKYFSKEQQPGKTRCKWGGILEERACFDPFFFAITPREAESMNPHQRLVMQESWKALEDAGCDPRALAGSQTGIFIGAEPTGYFGESFTGYSDALIASRLSYLLDLKGPAFVVNTGCSSSGVALHLACESLQHRQTDLVLAGGVNACMDHNVQVRLDQIGMLSPGGRCATFDQAGDGTVLSEGIGMVVLKRLEDAIACGDHIYGVIAGSGVNQDGASNGITAPNGSSQEALLTDLYTRFRIDPSRISYVEAHGTGTSLGDPVEANALVRAFRKFTDKQEYCAVGSAKSHIGHTAAAAGVISLIKVLLQLKHGEVPGLLHFTKMNPLIEFDGSPFHIPRETIAWESKDGLPRMAALSSFGHSGTNVHLVVKEYQPVREQGHAGIAPAATQPVMVILSARTGEQLRQKVRDLYEFIRKPIDLQAMAYTLQTGREAMEERMACIVSSVEALSSKLEAYLEGKRSIEHCYQGSARENQEILVLLQRDADLRETIDKWLQQGKYSKLLELWVKGLDLDWHRLYGGQVPGRISLPVYPFAREHYWVTGVPDNAITMNTRKLHPLVDENISDFEEQKYLSTFTGREGWLADHVIGGNVVMPGVAFIEMARAAAGLAQSQPVCSVTRIVWTRPLVMEKTATRVTISLVPAAGSIDFKIFTVEHDARVLHAEGSLRTGAIREHRDAYNNTVIESLQQECTTVVGQDAYYRVFREAGYSYGPAMQAIQSVRYSDKKALSLLVVPSACSEEYDQYELHPSVIDGALQTVMAINFANEAPGMLLPFALEEVNIYAPVPATCYASASLSAEMTGPQVKKYNVDILDEAGNLCVRFRNFSLRETGRVNMIVPPLPEKSEQTKVLYFHTDWVKSSEQEQAFSEKMFDKILLFDDTTGLKNGFEQRYSGAEVIVVKPGKKFQRQTHNCYTINPESFDDYSRLVAMLHDARFSPQAIVHAWSTSHQTGKNGELQTQLSLGIYSLFYLSKALMTHGSSTRVTLLYLHSGSRNRIEPHSQGVTGFLETLRKEHPDYQYKSISIDHLEDKAYLINIIERECAIGWGEYNEICYEGEQRYTRQPKEISIMQPGTLPLKTGGVYLITGGAGGLGLIFADYLAKKYKARIVLTGRSSLDREKAAQIKTIAGSGATIVYIEADISVYDQAARLIAQIKERFHRLDGIIHGAGIIRDSFIMKKTADEFASVIAPKVFGAAHLDAVCDKDELDFFVMFSSVSGKVGNPGQSDYAFANSFMDNFAIARNKLVLQGKRSGKTLSINWPLWEEGGMQIDQRLSSYMEKDTGMTLLSSEEGIRAFETALGMGYPQLLIARGERKQVTAVLTRASRKTDQAAMSFSASGAAEKELSLDNDLATHTEAYLKEVLADEFKLSISKINSKELLQKYGIDSIHIINMTRSLEQHFGELPKTLFFEYQNIEDLAAYFIKHHQPVLARMFRTNSVQAQPRMAEAVTHDSTAKEIPAVTTHRFDAVARSPYTTTRAIEDEIAIVGLSGRYPMAKNIDEFWHNLQAGKDCISEIPADRWDYREYFNPDREAVGSSYSKWGGFIDNVASFDPLFFNISPKDALLLDPQERLFLQTVWHTMEDAGYTPETLGSRNVGVFVGVMWGQYQLLATELEHSPMPNSLFASIANRVSYSFDFRGPSIAIDTMCSSSLTALHLATESMQRGECDVALVGGVNVTIHPYKYLQLSTGKFASSDGKCRSFGEGGDGYVPGEGVGAVMLKPLSRAVSDGDHIYGVVKACAINHGGTTNGYTVPNPNAQTEVIGDAMKKAGIDPRSITYIEAHGTGTALGDPIEITGLVNAFAGQALDARHCAIGSVKSNIGHLESAAGIAGLTKILLQMKHKKLVPSIHSEVMNPNIRLEETPFYVPHELSDWEQPVIEINGRKQTYPRMAGLSSFGAGGVNAHVLIEAYEHQPEEAGIPTEEKPELFLLSARQEERLKVYAGQMLDYLQDAVTRPAEGLPRLADMAYTTQVGRVAMTYRLAVVASSLHELLAALKRYCKGETRSEGLFVGNSKDEGVEALPGFDEQSLHAQVEKGDLQRIARQWVTGGSIDWRLLHNGASLRRVTLPVYPFQQKRYWITDGVKHSTQAESRKHKTVHDGKHVTPVTKPAESRQTLSSWKETLKGHDRYQGDEVILRIIDDEIALVQMQNRTHRNMFSENFSYGLMSKFLEIEQNEQIKAVIVTGYDNIFCMGGTQESLIDIAQQKNKFSDFPFIYQLMLECEVPVIAAMQGHASGGGLLFGLYSDIPIMAEEGIYTAVFTKYGFTPGLGATLIIREKLGQNLATEMMYTARSYKGAELKQRGASVRFAKQNEVVEEALRIAKMLAQKPRNTLKVLKKELAGRVLEQLPAIIAAENVMHAQTFHSSDVEKTINTLYRKYDGLNKPKDAGIVNAPRVPGQKIVLQPAKTDAGEYEEIARKKLLLKQGKGGAVITHGPAVVRETQSPVTTVKITTDQPAANTTVPGTSETPGLEAVQDKISALLMDILQLEAHEIDHKLVFKDYGMDSISGIEFIREINSTFQVNLDAADLYDHATIGSIARVVHDVNRENRELMRSMKQAANEGAAYTAGVGFEERSIITPEMSEAPAEASISVDDDQDTLPRIQEKIAALLMEILQLSADEIDPAMVFKDYGMDSISGLEFVREINNQFKVNLDAADLYDHATINTISLYIQGRLQEHGQALAVAGLAVDMSDKVQTETEPATEAVTEQTSEEQLLALLTRVQENDADIYEINELLEDIYE